MFAIVIWISCLLLLFYFASSFTNRKRNDQNIPPCETLVEGKNLVAEPDSPWRAVDTLVSVSGGNSNSRDDYGRDPNASELSDLKRIYHQVQNLENYPSVVPQARKLILSLLKQAREAARTLPIEPHILRIRHFSRDSLQNCLSLQGQEIGDRWREYLARRQAGGPKELFQDREDAEWWLKQIAPVKYVDGAWLSHINRVTLPYRLLPVVRSAWQVLSEEFGDGDLNKNHVHVYAKLLDSFHSGLPRSHDLDFIADRHHLDDVSVWRSAVAQLLICLFPHDFFPEILGFNLHFETVSLETLKATRELKEVGLDPYYFILHVSIDNAHCGHTAMAAETVCRYIQHVEEIHGADAAHQAWQRVQSGYLLSEVLPPIVKHSPKDAQRDNTHSEERSIDDEVISIFKAKAEVGQIMHCNSRCKIGRRTLSEWLDPTALLSKQWQADLLSDLSNSKYWVCRGDSDRSRFIKEILWGGRMFGCFTEGECETLRTWINDMPSVETASVPDILTTYPVFQGLDIQKTHHRSIQDVPAKVSSYAALEDFEPLSPDIRIIPEKLLPLWLTHTCLLQNFISVPSKAASVGGCAVLRVLRAQSGFRVGQQCTAGMDEVWRPHSIGIVELGLVLVDRCGLSNMSSLEDVLELWPSEFAIEMLFLSMYPVQNRGFLIGMATAFAKLHRVMSFYEGFAPRDQATLAGIASQEEDGLRTCWEDVKSDTAGYENCFRGYHYARQEIAKCFSCVQHAHITDVNEGRQEAWQVVGGVEELMAH